MGRSFGIVENKVEEAEFFLRKLEESFNEYVFSDEQQFFLSAFVSATRSITFTIQASISDIVGFDNWYAEHQKKLRANPLARYFLEARNLSQKIGYYLIAGSQGFWNETGNYARFFYFQRLNMADMEYVPEEDVLTGCKNYFRLLLDVVFDCYNKFGKIIDPEQYYTLENLNETNKTIEDFEEQAGYPRGWTGFSGLTVEQRLDLINRHHPKPSIDWIFEKYLGVNRFGEPVDEEKQEKEQ